MPTIDIETGHSWRNEPLPQSQPQPGLRGTAERGWIAGEHSMGLSCVKVHEVFSRAHLMSLVSYATLKQGCTRHAGVVLFLVFAGILPVVYVVRV